MNLAAAEKQAMQDFIKTAETSQQSSDPIMTSKEQREPIGRIILAFANTPSQYARIIKRSTQDLIAGRGDPKTHLSRIAYYGFLQNAIFNFLQQAMFTAMMGDDEEEDDSEMPEVLAKQEESRDKKMFKVLRKKPKNKESKASRSVKRRSNRGISPSWQQAKQGW